MCKQYYFLVTNIVTSKSKIFLAYDKFAAICRAVENDSYKYLNSQYSAKKTSL